MAQNTKIQWTNHTINLWIGCTHVHAGCDNCYAEALAKRFGNDVWGADKPRKAVKSVWSDLDRFQKLAAASGEIHRVFVGSMMDIFEKPMPVIDSKGLKQSYNTEALRTMLFQRIHSNQYPNLLFLFLTKRPSNINKYIFESWKSNPPVNVMFGASVVNQETADKLIPQLLQVNGKRFLSCEPLLGQVDIEKYLSPCSYYCDHSEAAFQQYCNSEEFNELDDDEQIFASASFYRDFHKPGPSLIDWIIVGGESGHKARPMHPDWACSIRDQCAVANVPFFFKQWGEYKDGGNMSDIKKFVMVGNDGKIYRDVIPKGLSCQLMSKVGKSKSGALINSKEYKEFPAL